MKEKEILNALIKSGKISQNDILGLEADDITLLLHSIYCRQNHDDEHGCKFFVELESDAKGYAWNKWRDYAIKLGEVLNCSIPELTKHLNNTLLTLRDKDTNIIYLIMLFTVGLEEAIEEDVLEGLVAVGTSLLSYQVSDTDSPQVPPLPQEKP